MDTTRDQYLIGRMVGTSAREQIDQGNFQASTVAHATHRWLVVHDIPKPREPLA